MLHRALNGILAGACALLLFGYVARGCENQELRAEKIEAEIERDSLAAEAAAERARANGWEASFGELVPGLQAELTERTDSLGTLARDLQASRVRIEELMTLTATAEGSIESTADSARSSPPDSTGATAGVWRGGLDDGLLAGSWAFRLPAASLGLDYRVTVPMELLRSVTGDGRVLVTARSTHPRANVTLDEILVDRPPPVEVETTNWSVTVLSTLAGIAGGAAWCPGR